jgi:hypothetical protein
MNTEFFPKGHKPIFLGNKHEISYTFIGPSITQPRIKANNCWFCVVNIKPSSGQFRSRTVFKTVHLHLNLRLHLHLHLYLH